MHQGRLFIVAKFTINRYLHGVDRARPVLGIEFALSSTDLITASRPGVVAVMTVTRGSLFGVITNL